MHERLPDHIEGNVLRAEFLLYHGRRPEVARAYEAAIAAGCDDLMVHLNYMRVLTEIAEYRGVLEYIVHHTAPVGSTRAFHMSVWSGHAKLALAADKASLIVAATEREQSAPWLSIEKAIFRLQTAIRTQQPLSLIRLGDGEARFLTFFDVGAREAISPEEAEGILDLHWQNWFGQSLTSTTSADLCALKLAFSDALAEANIVGTSTADRLDKDTIHRGYLNVMEGVLNELVRVHPEIELTDAFIHTNLNRRSPFYAELLSDLDFVGVVSPHPGLAARLARYHGIADYREYVVPGESRLPEAVRGRSMGPHFPDRYHEIMTGLQVPRTGSVFLVAAGLLGKIYCHRIQQLGGVGLDVGSIVDAWMGFDTRPDANEPRGTWKLPT
jgi:hypothetical protein